MSILSCCLLFFLLSCFLLGWGVDFSLSFALVTFLILVFWERWRFWKGQVWCFICLVCGGGVVFLQFSIRLDLCFHHQILIKVDTALLLYQTIGTPKPKLKEKEHRLRFKKRKKLKSRIFSPILYSNSLIFYFQTGSIYIKFRMSENLHI